MDKLEVHITKKNYIISVTFGNKTLKTIRERGNTSAQVYENLLTSVHRYCKNIGISPDAYVENIRSANVVKLVHEAYKCFLFNQEDLYDE